jgi:deaminated glutathione amidase
VRVALSQITSSPSPSENLSLVAEQVKAAAADGASVVLFPEATMARFGTSLGPLAEPLDGPWASAVREIASAHDVLVVAGMFTPSPDGRVFNTLLATGRDQHVGYDKIHLYDAFGFAESKTVAPGHEPVAITVDGVSVGLTLCYDVRFPELYVELAERGAQLITVHASWGSGPGKLEQWTLLARARAIDTTGYIAAVDRGHPDDDVAAVGPTGVGGSLVASPVGEVVASAGAEPQLLVTDIDLDSGRKLRETVAVMHNRAEFTRLGKAESRT